MKIKQWIKNKLGLNYPSDAFRHHEEMGRAISDGLKAGLEQPRITYQVDATDLQKIMHERPTVITHDMNFDVIDHDDLKRVMDVTGCTTEQAIRNITALNNIGQSGHVHDVQKDDRTVTEPLIREFAEKVNGQQEKVLASGKYEHPVHRTNHTALEWIGHAEDEFADLGVYLQCTKQTIQEVITDLELIQAMNEDETVDRMIQKVINRLK